METRSSSGVVSAAVPLTATTLPATPSAPSISTVTTTSFAVIVATNGNPASTTYSIRVTPDGGTAQFVQAAGALGALGIFQTFSQWGSASGTVVAGLSPNTNYSIAVAAKGGSTETAFGTSATQRTNAATTVEAVDSVPPAAPTSFLVSVTPNGLGVLLTWIDPSDADLSQITVLRTTGALPVTGAAYAVVEKGVQTYTDTRVDPGATYNYLLRASDKAGNVATSAQKTVTLPAIPVKKPLSTINFRRLFLASTTPRSLQKTLDAACASTGSLTCSVDKLFQFQGKVSFAPAIPSSLTISAYTKAAIGTAFTATNQAGISQSVTVLAFFGKPYDLLDPRAQETDALAAPVTFTLRTPNPPAKLFLRSAQKLVLSRRDPTTAVWSRVPNVTADLTVGSFTATTTTQGAYVVAIVDEG